MVDRDVKGASDYPAKSAYQGLAATRYVAKRKGTRQWRREQELLSQWVLDWPVRSIVLDVPVGAGRFEQLLQSGDQIGIGVDISTDMLREARSGGYPRLICAEAEKLPLRDGSVDYSICLRFSNWLPIEILERCIVELARVTRQEIVLETHESVALERISWIWLLTREGIMDPRKLVRRALKRMRRRDEGASEAKPKYHFHDVIQLRRLLDSAGLEIVGRKCIMATTVYHERARRRIMMYLLRSRERGQVSG